MAKLKGKRVIITFGIHKGAEGEVIYEDQWAVTIRASGLFGDLGWFGRYYALKKNVKLAPGE